MFQISVLLSKKLATDLQNLLLLAGTVGLSANATVINSIRVSDMEAQV